MYEETAGVNELVAERKNAESILKYSDALKRLQKNRDFKLLIQQEYLNDNAVRLVHASGNYRLTDPERESIQKDIYAVSSFAQFLDAVHAQGQVAEDTIKQIDDVLNEEMTEEAEA